MKKNSNKNIESLKTLLKDRMALDDAAWIATLETRKKKELEFHNNARTVEGKNVANVSEGDNRANRRWYSITSRSDLYLTNWLVKNSQGKVFLDNACGNGGQTRKAARYGAELAIGIDISGDSIRNARTIAEQENMSEQCYFIQTDCENTYLPDASVDTILCCGMLHHLDLSYVFPEMRRILRKEGRILAVEALGHNPLIQAYRQFTPELRTDFEKDHILKYEDIKFASRFFKIENIKYWHFTAIPCALIRNTNWFGPVFKILDNLDKKIFERLPAINKWSWQITFEMVKM